MNGRCILLSLPIEALYFGACVGICVIAFVCSRFRLAENAFIVAAIWATLIAIMLELSIHAGDFR